MKSTKIIKAVFVISVLSGIFTACGTTKVSKTRADEKPVSDELNRRVISATGIGNLVKGNNIEGAYYRMDAGFQGQTPYKEFAEKWATLTDGLGEVLDFAVDTSEYESLSFYKPVKVVYKFAEKDIVARYLYTSASILPTDVLFDDKSRTISNDAQPLKDLCKDYFRIGCGITGAYAGNSAIRVPEFMEIVKDEFSSCTSTNLMKPSYILNQNMSMRNHAKGLNEPGLDFSVIDPTLQWCSKNGVQVRGHTLVWHSQTPEWFFKEGFKTDGAYVSRDVMIERLDSFVKQYLDYVQKNYPGTIYCWDVVNEAVDPDKGDSSTNFMCRITNDGKDSGWYQTIGTDYPEVAFTIARKYADKDVKLFYNDYGAIDRRKRECIYNLCKSLKEKGLIDGIGMQGYWDMKNPVLSEVQSAINLYAELGLELQLTEWSIPVPAENEQEFNKQAERYASVFKLLKTLDTDGGGNANITCVSFFGVQDHYVLSQGDTNNTRLWDKNFNPKPVYFAIQDVFKLYY